MRLLTKEFYALSELQAAWDMPDQDVYYLAMSGQLKLTFMVHDTQVRSPLPLMHYRNREVGRNYSGILDLKVRDADRSLAAALQHRQAAQLARLSPTGPGNGDAAMAALRFRYAPPTDSHGARGNLALTINADHSVGAGHYPSSLGQKFAGSFLAGWLVWSNQVQNEKKGGQHVPPLLSFPR